VIVVDDCGPEDGTRAAVEAFAARFPSHRVEWIRHETNRGVSAARNTAIAASNGEFLAFLDPDDLWAETYLEEHMTVLARDRGLAVSYTDARYIDESGAITGGIWGPSIKDLDSWPDGLYMRNFINPSMALARASVVRDTGGFDETPELQHVEDWDLWLRLVALGERFAYTPSAIGHYRRHEAAATSNVLKISLRTKVLREKHLETADFRRFMAAYVTDLEQKCGHLEWLLGQPMCKRIRDRAVGVVKGALRRPIRWFAELVARPGK
jgi:GT2 family glycosyltransferase